MRISRACARPARRSWAADPVTNHRQTLDLPYRPEDLFDLASDIGRYPDFIHWIQSLKLLSEQEDEKGMRCRAEVRVGFKGFSETFITDVDANRAERTIDVKLVRGPFKKLANTWSFQPIPTGTRVDDTEQLALQALDIIKREAGAENVRITLAFLGVHAPNYPINLIYLWNGGSEEGVLQVQLNDDSGVDTERLKERLREVFARELPDVSFSFEPSDIVSQVMSLGSATPIEVAVSGPNLAANREFATRVRERLARIPSLRDVPSTDLPKDLCEIEGTDAACSAGPRSR